ncbi:enoyl-CoA hydratase-related protein [Aeromicrobium yanjiei]|uniref:Enoyl-CoA hydratase n=1 Tax=Aeromicrobium yanjiei TaxID=2662028 RepID=A0A5Q2MIL6_9ACTN|nr:enoyl-CoA hydratase-related protein [Aeromicrobium yanjiei]QGG42974.1 enoyl-CoA hydratase [Aeromicrobium yanjiei]
MAELVHLDIDKRVATITLDSEYNRNALSKQLVSELMTHVETADVDPQVRVIVLRSAGPVFCSGADMAEASEGGMVEGAKAMVAMQLLIATASKPVVVELDGPVRAGGLGIVGAADIVLAAESVTFQLTEVRLALAPAIISLSLLPRLTERAASELFLTARTFGAAEAAAIGMITRAVPEGELADEVDRVVGDLARAYPQGLRETKKLLNHDLVARIDTHGANLAQLSGELFGSDEARAAMRAFLDRRK